MLCNVRQICNLHGLENSIGQDGVTSVLWNQFKRQYVAADSLCQVVREKYQLFNTVKQYLTLVSIVVVFVVSGQLTPRMQSIQFQCSLLLDMSYDAMLLPMQLCWFDCSTSNCPFRLKTTYTTRSGAHERNIFWKGGRDVAYLVPIKVFLQPSQQLPCTFHSVPKLTHLHHTLSAYTGPISPVHSA